MTEIQRPRRTTWWRAVSRAAVVLRDLHHQQVYAWECLLRANRVAIDRPGPLTWTPSLDGPRLAGSWLTAPDDFA
jgi:hypothetical protein